MNLSAQNIKNKNVFDYQVREEKGDLNNDGKADKITVKMNIIDETRPSACKFSCHNPMEN